MNPEGSHLSQAIRHASNALDLIGEARKLDANLAAVLSITLSNIFTCLVNVRNDKIPEDLAGETKKVAAAMDRLGAIPTSGELARHMCCLRGAVRKLLDALSTTSS